MKRLDVEIKVDLLVFSNGTRLGSGETKLILVKAHSGEEQWFDRQINAAV